MGLRVPRSNGAVMTIPAIIEVILRTPSLQGTSIGLAAHVARNEIRAGRTAVVGSVKDVADFWRRNGGTVEGGANV